MAKIDWTQENGPIFTDPAKFLIPRVFPCWNVRYFPCCWICRKLWENGKKSTASSLNWANYLTQWLPPAWKLTCPQKWDCFKRKFQLTTINFRGICSFSGGNIFFYVHSICGFMKFEPQTGEIGGQKREINNGSLCAHDNTSSWWFQPNWKILVKLEIFPR